MNIAHPHRSVPPADCREMRTIYLRSLALQASWNPVRMQHLGLLTALLPWFRRQDAGRDETRTFCRDHFGYFNTNPYMANYLLGGLVRLEAESRAAGGGYARTIRSFKDSVGRALASIGDQLFWLGLHPGLIVVAALTTLSGIPWLPLVPFGMFAVGQMIFRLMALNTGYRLGMDIVDLLGSSIWHRLILVCKRGGAMLTGVLAGVAALGAARLAGDPETRATTLGVVLAFMLTLALRRRVPGEYVLLLLVPLAMLLAAL